MVPSVLSAGTSWRDWDQILTRENETPPNMFRGTVLLDLVLDLVHGTQVQCTLPVTLRDLIE
eukprot:COSAG02_NODE_3505_length_6637_cov_2.581217_10_plen_62_part_00